MITGILRAREALIRIAALEEALFPLDRAALTISIEDYPDLRVEDYLQRLDMLAARTEAQVGRDRSPANILDSLNEVLFGQESLRGNEEDYYDPRNSYLNEVLDRKQGIPISLSVIYMEVARRIGFPLQGVGFPGHFIVKYPGPEREILIDPFHEGRILTLKHCQELLDRLYGDSLTVQPTFFQPMEKKAIISRMLFNLKGIYYQREEFNKALSILERILIINPLTLSEIRDRGLLFMQTNLFARALADLEYYLAHASAPEDSSHIARHIATLRRIVAPDN